MPETLLRSLQSAEEPGLVMIVDDDVTFAAMLQRACLSVGFKAITISDQPTQMSSWQYPKPDVVVLDLNLGFNNGLEFLERLVARGFSGPTLLVSGCDPRVLKFSEQICRDLGVQVVGSIAKPFPIRSFLDHLEGIRCHAQELGRQELEAGLEEGHFVPYFQPIMGADGETLYGAEVLARWCHPRLGLIKPALFVEPIERLGLMERLTMGMLKQTLQHAAQWRRSGTPVELAVNVSPSILLMPDFVERLLEAIRLAAIEPGDLKIEITEAVAFVGLDSIMRILTRLRIAGVRLSLDDFGTGYSSLTALHRLPFSDMKIDRSFVSRIMIDPEAATIVHSLIELAHNLGLQVVAEGVETTETLQRLQDYRCDRLQGFLFSEPLPAESFAQWLPTPQLALPAPPQPREAIRESA